MTNNEAMITVNGGWLYFKTNAAEADKALDRFHEACENAGIDISNIEISECEVRNEDGDAMDTFRRL